MTPVNPEWHARGQVCRDNRVNGGAYRTMKELAPLVGVDFVTISKMENGKADPTPLEAYWSAHIASGQPSLLSVAEEMYAHLEREYGSGIANGYWETVAALMQRAAGAISRAKATAFPTADDRPEDIEGREECPHCSGSGWQNLNGTMLMECPECGGDGDI